MEKWILDLKSLKFPPNIISLSETLNEAYNNYWIGGFIWLRAEIKVNQRKRKNRKRT